MSENCQRCGKRIEPDGFCSHHGKWFGLWLCNACVELDVDCLEQEEAD